MKETLVLSAAYEPLKIIAWQKAIQLILQEKVEVLQTYSTFVHSPSLTLPLPAVVSVKRYIRPFVRLPKLSRRNLFQRDKYTCQYCLRLLPPHLLTYDHVIPRSRGGKTTWTNLVTACAKCNTKKGNKPLSKVGYQLLQPPTEPRWQQSLRYSMGHESPQAWQGYLVWGK